MELKTGTFVPTRKEPSKNLEAFNQINTAFSALPIGDYVEVSDSDVKSSTLEGSAREFITLKAGEYLKISRVRTEIDGKSKVTAVRLVKSGTAPKPRAKKAPAQGATPQA